MFENIDKKKNKKNAIIGLILIAIPLILYINNNMLKLPKTEEIKKVEIVHNEKIIKVIDKLEEIDKIKSELSEVHKKYLVMGNDPTKKLLEVRLILDSNTDYLITFRDSTIEYNGHLYDINPDKYKDFIKNYSK
ncbi:hypothetical protein ACWOAQ_03735 [Helcococcus kunzii]|uniref:DUF5301 domain-containing protein n=1 Tax=Helcococcus kunzii ATCC 51366 TaxID=883114 RepID=H3NQM3_9FIRM|nr:hypothetical protein [Helcococcus kunzii]EHR32353.1 hypothetical protein HMPREF9709_01634 [Helcococcus kunzii ATCC 51366]MCT1796516.1 hypothetical protein [Helcococcus kunzii]MCT1988328.1 hypothetical protein [Helcococcus kunzii]QZO76146.1 hypothetical protein HIF96_07630 [Helcococcus kunzii]